MGNSKKRKAANIGQMKESLTKHPRHDKIQRKIQAFIPEDLIHKIILILPTRSMGRFRCVSKSWLSFTACPSFITAHVQHRRFAHQTLMTVDQYHKKSQSKTRLFLPSFEASINARINMRELPQMHILQHSKLLYSCDGLVLSWIPMKKRHCIINPLTGHLCILPRSRFEDFMGFYFHRPTSEYRLLADWDEETYILVIGKTKWRRIHNRLPCCYFESNPVDVNESLYWLAWNDSEDEDVDDFSSPNILLTFDKETEVFNSLHLPPLQEFNGLREGSLLNFNGELGLCLISGNGIIDLWIMKECWIKMYSMYHPDLEGCSKKLSYRWNDGSAVSIKDEELLIGVFAESKRHFLVHWNLKTGACFVQNLKDYSPKILIHFPYIEAYTFFDHSYKSVPLCSRS